MALKAKLANKVQTNQKGLVEGTIIRVLEIDERTEIEKGKEVTYAAQFEFHIEAVGSQKSIIYRIWTNQKFNDEKTKERENVKDYNDFTRLMLQLQVINESDLQGLKSSKISDFDVESVQGFKVTFELEESKKAKGLKVPKLTSITPLKPSKPNAK